MATSSHTLITLNETLVILLPEYEWIRDAAFDLLKSRWMYARSKYISEHACEPPVKCMADDKMHAALPFDVACDNVTRWIPWALHMLSEDLKEVCGKSGDYTIENIAYGANAGEEITSV